MISIKVKILFAMGLSVLFTYSGILYLNYGNIPEMIPTHINFRGEVDGYGNKIQLWIISIVNLFLILIIYLVAKFPKYWNIPFEPKNLLLFQKNVKISMGILSILLSFALSTMIFFTLKYSTIEILRLFFLILVLPSLFVILFKERPI
ncbi:MAG: DUF1648 domain-containing protein [Flavobacteriaceae bacterium]